MMRVATTLARPTGREPERATWLRVAEVSRLLGMSANTVRRWTDAGRIPAHRSPGGHRRYLLDEILALAPDVELAPAVRSRGAGRDASAGRAVRPHRDRRRPSAAAPAPGGSTLDDLIDGPRRRPHDVPSRAVPPPRWSSSPARRAARSSPSTATTSRSRRLRRRRRGRHREGRPAPPARGLAPPADDAADGAGGPASRRRLADRGGARCASEAATPCSGRRSSSAGRCVGALEVCDPRDRDLAPHLPLATPSRGSSPTRSTSQATSTDLDQRRRTMRELIGLSQEVARATDLQSFVKTVAERVMTATNADYVDIWRVEDGRARRPGEPQQRPAKTSTTAARSWTWASTRPARRPSPPASRSCSARPATSA